MQTLQSTGLSRANFQTLDVDCPACLFLLQHQAHQAKQKAKIRDRDSSSTLLGKDMKAQNTSRVFVKYQ